MVLRSAVVWYACCAKRYSVCRHAVLCALMRGTGYNTSAVPALCVIGDQGTCAQAQ
jgi:hypothetical protein